MQIAAIDCFEPAVDAPEHRSEGPLQADSVEKHKKSKLSFSTKIHCIKKAGAICAEELGRATHITKPLIWPAPLTKISTWRSATKFIAVFR